MKRQKLSRAKDISKARNMEYIPEEDAFICKRP